MPLGNKEPFREPHLREAVECIAELEEVGLPVQLINFLEEQAGIVYIRDLAKADAKKLVKMTWMGEVRWIYVAIALARALKEVKVGEKERFKPLGGVG